MLNQMEIDDLRTEIDMLRKGARVQESKISELKCVVYMAVMLCDAIDLGVDVRNIKDAVDHLRNFAKEAIDETI